MVNLFFWRTYDGGEIDLIEEKNEQVNAFEFKCGLKRKASFPESFINTYQPGSLTVITPENVHEFLLGDSSRNQ